MLFNITTRSQAPQGISYQAVLRSSDGNTLINQNIKLRFSIRDSIINGKIVFQEDHSLSTNSGGIVNLIIGSGVSLVGTFTSINWGQNSKFIQVELDVNPPSSYTDLGISQMMSVPYALFAGSSANGIPGGGTNGQVLSIVDGVPKWVTIFSGGTLIFPEAPQSLVGNSISTTKVNLSWQDKSTNELGFKVERKTETSAFEVIGTTQSNVTNYIDSDGLSLGQSYTYRVYSFNSVGNSNTYSNETLVVTQISDEIIINTTSVSSITLNSAVVDGVVLSDGGSNVTTRGAIWSTSPNPLVGGQGVDISINGAGLGNFKAVLNNLNSNTEYFARTYAQNSKGTIYGNEINFLTKPPAEEGSITIGSQVWMDKNLDVNTYQNGDPIPQVVDNNEWFNLKSGAWATYDNDLTNGNVYGKLYNFYAVTDSRKLCPVGWHIPTLDEYNTLIDYLGGLAVAGAKLKSTGTTNWMSPNVGATNETGFNALGAGVRNSGGSYSVITQLAYFWTSSTNEYGAISVSLRNNGGDISTSATGNITMGYSIRCIRD